MTYQQIKKKALLIGIFLLFCMTTTSYATSLNKVFHQPYNTRSFFNKQTSSTAALFFSHAYKGYDYNDKKSNILAIDGTYNIKTITQALKIFNEEKGNIGYQDPLHKVKPLGDYDNRDLIYDVGSTVRTCGITLQHEQAVYKEYLSIGASLPIVYLNTLNKVAFSKKKSSSYFGDIFDKNSTEWHKIEVARRDIHQELDLKGNLLATTGIGDVEFHVSGQYTFNYALLCKEIELAFRVGGIAPTGIQRDDNYLSSVSFGNEGFWSVYAVAGFYAILKQNLHIGCLTSLTVPIAKTVTNKRIALFEEADYVSPLKKDLDIRPGVALSVSPYVIFENLLDGVHFQIQYAYLQHSKDEINEVLTENSSASYLTRVPSALTSANISADDLKDVRKKKKNNKWLDHYLSFEVLYNPKTALKKWWCDPHFYFLYNYPLGGRGTAFNHHVSFGMTLHF